MAKSMDEATVIHNLRVLADLLDIENGNPHQTRNLRKVADVLSLTTIEEALTHPASVPGLGPQTLKLIQTLESEGLPAACEVLQLTVPLTLRDLVRLPGIGPKTAHNLYHQHGIDSIEALLSALTTGRLTRLPGFGVHRLHRLKRDAAVLLERKHALPIALCWPSAVAIASELADIPGVAQTSVTGAARRLQTMCSCIEIVVAVTDSREFDQWCEARNGLRKKNWIDFKLPIAAEPARLRLYPTSKELFASRLMETTGDETHVGVIQGMLDQQGIQWTEYGLMDEAGQPVRTGSEADIYAQAGLPDYPPELREGRGLLQPPTELVQRSDIRGDLHVHSNWSDGSLSIAEVVATAERMGYEYIAITDHSQSLTIAGGLTPEDLLRQRAEIEAVRRQAKIHVLHGTEVDILPDGALDLPGDVLRELDLVVASIHSAMHQPKAQITHRLLNAVQHPAVDIIGHMTGRMIGRRAGYEIDIEQVFTAAASTGKTIELNANPNRLDISDELLRQATSFGLTVSIDTDAHHPHEFAHMAYGIRMATRGWLRPGNVLNTLPYDELITRLHRRRLRR